MKPELKVSAHAYGLIAQGPLMGRSIETSKDLFLSSLHWRGDELWAGPIEVGDVSTFDRSGFGPDGAWHNVVVSRWRLGQTEYGPYEDEAEARAALEAAAKKQINEWFQEQAR